MKAKKPLLLAVLVVSLLAVALILPAVATGKSDNQPLNWVSQGENSNNTLHSFGLQAGHSILVKQTSDGTLVGNGTFHLRTKPEKSFTIHTKDVYGYEPVFQNDVTYESYLYTVTGGMAGVRIEHAKVAKFYMDFGADVGLMKLVLVDGGEPKTCDYEETYAAFPDPEIPGDTVDESDLAFFGENVPFSNIQIHYGGEPPVE